MTPTGDPAGGFVMLAIIFGIYFLPTIVGWNHRNGPAILVLNFFLGWTLIGWVLALVWACTDNPRRA